MLAPLPSGTAAANRTAEAFEAQALGALFQLIFATTGAAPSSFGGGAGEEAWAPMLVDAVASRLAAAGGFGIANSVRAEILRMQGEAGTSIIQGDTP